MAGTFRSAIRPGSITSCESARRGAVEQLDEADDTPSRRHDALGGWRGVRIRAPGVSQLIRVFGRLSGCDRMRAWLSGMLPRSS
jgi:hypothetical protein